MPIPQDLGGAPAQLTWYIGTDGALYARELQTGGVFKLASISSQAPDTGPAGPQGPPGPQGEPGEGGTPSELAMVSPDGLSTVNLALVDGGDVVATQASGPNAGKSVNLTYGQWV